ncbi:MAG: hypothetical protein RKE49_15320 [Oceanicaulis sp.]
MKPQTIILTAALFLAGCGGGERTVEIEGTFAGFEGAAVSGVRVQAQDRDGAAVSGPDGAFAFTVRKHYAANFLPVSGVYLDPVSLYAEGPDGAAGYGAAMALSTSGQADPALLVLLPEAMLAEAQAQLDSRGAQCGGVPGRAFAHAFLGHLDQIAAQDRFRRAVADGVTGQGLRWRVEQLLMGARTDCGLSEENWRGDLDALEAVFDPQ